MLFQDSFGLIVTTYLFLTGLGVGCIASATVVDLYHRKKYLSYIKSSSLLGAPIVLIGCLLLLSDLGRGLKDPSMLIYLFSNPYSVITWGTVLLIIFLVFSTVYLAYNFNIIKFGGSRLLKYFLLFISVATALYSGALLSVLKSIPFWHQATLPVLFLASSLSMGIALTSITEKIFYRSCDISRLETAHLYLIIAEMMVLGGILLSAVNGVPEVIYSANAIIYGKYAVKFWIVLVLLCGFIPMIFHMIQETKRFMIKMPFHIIIEILILVGGFYLRYIIVNAGVFTSKI